MPSLKQDAAMMWLFGMKYYTQAKLGDTKYKPTYQFNKEVCTIIKKISVSDYWLCPKHPHGYKHM